MVVEFSNSIPRPRRTQSLTALLSPISLPLQIQLPLPVQGPRGVHVPNQHSARRGRGQRRGLRVTWHADSDQMQLVQDQERTPVLNTGDSVKRLPTVS